MSSFPRTNQQLHGQHLGAWLRAGNPAGTALGAFYFLGAVFMAVAPIKKETPVPGAKRCLTNKNNHFHMRNETSKKDPLNYIKDEFRAGHWRFGVSCLVGGAFDFIACLSFLCTAVILTALVGLENGTAQSSQLSRTLQPLDVPAAENAGLTQKNKMKNTKSPNGDGQETASAITSIVTLNAMLDDANLPGPHAPGVSSCPTQRPVKFGPLDLPLFPTCADRSMTFAEELVQFRQFGCTTECGVITYPTAAGIKTVPVYSNSFFMPKQRQANSLHGISYRASFKAELPRFYIERLTQPGDIVLDPFSGRGTVALESGLLGRIPYSNDLNPLSWYYTAPRLHPPTWKELVDRLNQIDLNYQGLVDVELLVFYHAQTLRQIYALRHYFLTRQLAGEFDHVDAWLCMVVLNRLTGQSKGFLSVITKPPTFAVSVNSQRRINERKMRVPEERDVRAIILKKSRQLLRHVDECVCRTLAVASVGKKLITGPAEDMPEIPQNSVDLVVTSPPFLNVVNYAKDNWLRCWFINEDPAKLKLTVTASVGKWTEAMTAVMHELHRVLKPGGYLAFEVGEVRRGKLKLEETVLPCGVAVGLVPELVMINTGEFTKISHCWHVHNGTGGTNTNRVVVFRKAD